jgi:2-polyprenyl-3-methyl-5-hydroxy-6-metoxy-1,4-benzoquinol methylase
MQKKQKKQDSEYNFPYHYIPQFRNNYKQFFLWGWSKNYTSAIEFLLKEISNDLKNNDVIFDIGCGDGRLTQELAIEFTNTSIIGIDYSKKAIDLARAMNPTLEFYNIDIIKNNFHKKCNLVTLIEVFEHIPLDSCDEFIESIYNVLDSTGILYLTVPHINVPVSDKHFQHFDIDMLKKYFSKYFHFEDIRYIQKNSFFLKIMNRLMSNSLFIISNAKLNNVIYSLYKKYYFFSSDKNCERIYIKMKKKINL